MYSLVKHILQVHTLEVDNPTLYAKNNNALLISLICFPCLPRPCLLILLVIAKQGHVNDLLKSAILHPVLNMNVSGIPTLSCRAQERCVWSWDAALGCVEFACCGAGSSCVCLTDSDSQTLKNCRHNLEVNASDRLEVCWPPVKPEWHG